MLGQLKCAGLRSRLMTAEIDSIVTALSGNFIGTDDAVAWAQEAGATDRHIVNHRLNMKGNAMPRLSTPPKERAAFAAAAKERAKARKTNNALNEPTNNEFPMTDRKSWAPTEEEFRERIAAFNQERGATLGGSTTTKNATPTENTAKEDDAAEIDQLKASAAAIIASKNVLDLFAAEFSRVIAGERTNGKLLT